MAPLANPWLEQRVHLTKTVVTGEQTLCKAFGVTTHHDDASQGAAMPELNSDKANQVADTLKKSSIPLWKQWSWERIFIWALWLTVLVWRHRPGFGLKIPPEWEHVVHIGFPIFLLFGLPAIVAGFVGTKKAIGFILASAFYPIVAPFLLISFTLAIQRFLRRLVSTPLLKLFHFGILLGLLCVSFSVKSPVVLLCVRPFLYCGVVSNLVNISLWLFRPMRFLSWITAQITKHEKAILAWKDKSNLGKSAPGFLLIRAKMQVMSTKTFVCMAFAAMILPGLAMNVLLFAGILRSEYLISTVGGHRAFSGVLVQDSNWSFIRISVGFFLNVPLQGLDIFSRHITNLQIFEAASFYYIFSIIFFAYTIFAHERAEKAIESFQLAVDSILKKCGIILTAAPPKQELSDASTKVSSTLEGVNGPGLVTTTNTLGLQDRKQSISPEKTSGP